MLFLALSHLSFQIDNTSVLQHIDLSLNQGEIGCILGPSGCGKTTLLRLIAGFYTPSGGGITLCGNTISKPDHSLAPEHRNIGVVFQDYALFPHLTVSDNLQFGLKKWPAAKRHQRLQEMLELTDLEAYAQRYPHELSGGQQQRVALGRALATQPKLLLLDEPFSNLDASLRRQLSQKVRKLLKSQDTTALMVTHDQQEAFGIADKIGVLNQGHLLQWGSPEQLYHHPNSPEVATFVGHGQLVKGIFDEAGCATTALGPIQVQSKHPLKRSQILKIVLRPNDFTLGKYGCEGHLLSNQFLGFGSELEIQLHSNERIFCQTHDICTLKPQQCVHLQLKPGYYRAFIE